MTTLTALTALTACSGGPRVAPNADLSGATARLAGGGLAILPARYDPSRRYPVLVYLPASNGTAAAMRREYPSPGDVIVVVSAGEGTPRDYRTNAVWQRTIERYERQLRADLGELARGGRGDMSRVVLAGFSMGGDLAWALTLRNPTLVHGAVIMGSRMSYRADTAGHEALARRGIRFAVIMGAREDRTRAAGARAGVAFLRERRIPHRYREVNGLAHLRAPAAVFSDALGFVLED